MTTLTPHQDKAVKAFADWYHYNRTSQFYLGGYAGTGKSTILPPIVSKTKLSVDEIAFCAPTGKAAKVMTTKMKAAGMGAVSTTIHKLIYKPVVAKVELIEARISQLVENCIYIDSQITAGDDSPGRLAELNNTIEELNKLRAEREVEYKKHKGPMFILRENEELRDTKSLIIVDEASMVGTKIAEDLKSFDIPILAIGDPGQLPPVSDTPGFTAGQPDAFLHEIHRQAADNPIIWLSQQVRDGKPLKLGTHGPNVRIIKRKDDTYTTADREQQVIVGRNVTRWKVTEKIRKAAGYTSTGPQVGEPLIVCKNSRLNPHLVNGTFVECEADAGDLEDKRALLSVLIRDEAHQTRHLHALQGLFEEHLFKEKDKRSAPFWALNKELDSLPEGQKEVAHLDWGWAITCHKSQGSQWDNVVVHDESSAFRDDWSRWLYTAITRAATDLTVVE